MADPIQCPFCESVQTELISLFGSQLLLSQYRCTACGTYFEAIRKSASQHDRMRTEETTRGS